MKLIASLSEVYSLFYDLYRLQLMYDFSKTDRNLASTWLVS